MAEEDRDRIARLETDFRRLLDVLADGRLTLGDDPHSAEGIAEYGRYALRSRAQEERQLFRIYDRFRRAEYLLSRFDLFDRLERALADAYEVLAKQSGGSVVVSGHSYEPIRMFLEAFDEDVFVRFEIEVHRLCALMGYEEIARAQLEFGSIFSRGWARVRRTFSKNENLIEESIAAAIDQPRAQRDNVDASTERSMAEAVKLRAEARLADAQARKTDAETRNLDAATIRSLADSAATLATILERIPEGVTLQVGPLIVAKAEGGSTVARVLSEGERVEWEHDGRLLQDPARAAQRLQQLSPPGEKE